MRRIIQNDRLLNRPARDRVSALIAAIVLALACLTAGSLTTAAQDKNDVIRVDTELATFEITVTDRHGKPVKDLSADDLRVFENGVERPIDFFQPLVKQATGRPLSVVFALDVSGSMTESEIGRLRSALQVFVNRLADYNSYFAVMSFAMNVRTLQSFTNQPSRLERSFGKLTRDQDGLSTHAYDAVDDAIRLIQRRSPRTLRNQLPKRAVILITDGFPVGDTVTPETVIERANAAETTVYSVILPSYSRLQQSSGPLPTPLEASGLIQRTGGRSFYANEKDFEPLFRSLAEEVTASYALAFYPDASGSNSSREPRQVRIESKQGYIVRQNRTSFTIAQ